MEMHSVLGTRIDQFQAFYNNRPTEQKIDKEAIKREQSGFALEIY